MKVTKAMLEMRKSGMTMQQVADELGVNPSTVSRAFSGRADRVKPAEIDTTAAATPRVKAGTLTAASIVAQFNTTEKVIKTLEALPADEFKRENDLILSAGITKVAWNKAKRSDKLKEAGVRLPDGSYVWGRPRDAAALRRKLLEV